MTAHEQWTDRLSEYLDGELSHGERQALEAHLGGCGECRALLEELRAVVVTARTLPALPPERDLWPAVAERTRDVVPFPSRTPRRLPEWTRLAAAAVLFAAVGSGVTWLAFLRSPAAVPVAVAPAAPTTPLAPQSVAHEPRGTGAAIAELEQIVRGGRSRLDTATVRIVTENLARIDAAIAEAQRALASDPSNAYVGRHLADTQRRKLELLRTAAHLVQSQS
jgi:anti-sigma factor RsiW